MDDTARDQTQDATQPAGGAQRHTASQPMQPPPPPTHTPVSLPHKELAPSGQSVDHQADIRISAPEPELRPEVAEAGVSVTTHTPPVHADAAAAGLAPAKDAAPVVTTPTGSVQLPMTRGQARQAKEKYGIRFSIRWMAELVLEQFKRARQRKLA